MAGRVRVGSRRKVGAAEMRSGSHSRVGIGRAGDCRVSGGLNRIVGSAARRAGVSGSGAGRSARSGTGLRRKVSAGSGWAGESGQQRGGWACRGGFGAERAGSASRCRLASRRKVGGGKACRGQQRRVRAGERCRVGGGWHRIVRFGQRRQGRSGSGSIAPGSRQRSGLAGTGWSAARRIGGACAGLSGPGGNARDCRAG